MKHRKSYLFFFLYFLFTVAFPASHCHAEQRLADSRYCGAGFNAEHIPGLSKDSCCELHEDNHDEADAHHIHFLMDDQNASIRLQITERSVAPLYFTVSEQISPVVEHPFLSFVFLDIFKTSHKGFPATFSGLSPPLSNLS